MDNLRILILAIAVALITLILALAFRPYHYSPPATCGKYGVKETRTIESVLWVVCENGRTFSP
jgi:hypothetical protein